jgi:hypothetical protein
VDPKTVQRWVTQGRSPHRTTATRVAKLLDVPLTWLWPELEGTEKGEGAGEVVNLYAHRSQVPRQCWLDLVVRARKRIDFLTYASLFMPEENPESVDILKYKAGSGVHVRLALGDPDSVEVALRGREEGMPQGIPGRVRMALAYYRPLLGVPGVTFHLHRTTLYNSIYRFDDDMMVNQHAYGTYGYMAPILHLKRVDGGELFSLYERSFELAWRESFPYEPAA